MYNPNPNLHLDVLSADFQLMIRLAIVENDEACARFLDTKLAESPRLALPALFIARNLQGWI